MFDAHSKLNDFKFVDGNEMPFETTVLIAVVKSKMHVFVSSEIVFALRESPSRAKSLRERVHADYSCNYAGERKAENGRSRRFAGEGRYFCPSTTVRPTT
jgi:hypothetical protein